MDFDKLNPIIALDGNCLLTRMGDLSIAYAIDLPEINTVSVSEFNNIHNSLKQMMLLLPENVVIHKQDIYKKSILESQRVFNGNDFWEESLISHFKDRPFLEHTSYLYFTLLDSVSFKRSVGSSLFFKQREIDKKVKDRLEGFHSSVRKAVASIKNAIHLRALEEVEFRKLIDYHLMGYSIVKAGTVFFKPDYQIGSKYYSIYGLDEDVNQKDGDIDLATINEQMSSEISNMYESYMSGFSSKYNEEHVLNSFMFLDNQSAIKKEIRSNSKKLNILQSSKDNSDIQAGRVSDFLKNVEKENAKIVRSHFNVTVWDSNKERLNEKEDSLLGVFGKAGIIPTEYGRLDYPYLYMANTPGCGGHLPKEYTFLSIMDIGLIYFNYESSAYQTSEKGIFYTNRTNSLPMRIDTFFEPYESKLIENRNYFVIAPSGGGKSFSSKSRLFQQYKMGFDQVVINIGGDDKLVKLINSVNEGDALYVEYVEGDTLPVNPFYVEGFIDNAKVEFLSNFIWLIWGGKDEIDNDSLSILNKILYIFYGVNQYDDTYHVGKGFKVVIDSKKMCVAEFYRYVKYNRKEIGEYFDNEVEMFNITSLLLNLEKFAIGSYSYLFENGKPMLADKRKYIEFELDKIKDHPFLFPIFSMLISDVTFNTMWNDEGEKDFFVDECWKILEKQGMAVLLKYLFKTIRKFDGGVGIAVQQITDLEKDPIIRGAILGNCDIKYVLNHKNVLGDIPLLKERLTLRESDIAMLLSIKNKTSPSYPGDRSRYTEQLLKMGSDFSKIVRVEVSPELAVIYDSEKKRLRKFNKIYKECNKDVRKTVMMYLAS